MRIALNLFPQFEVALELLVDPPLESLDRPAVGREDALLRGDGYILELHPANVGGGLVLSLSLRREDGAAFTVKRYGVDAVAPLVRLDRVFTLNAWNGGTAALVGLPGRFRQQTAANRGIPLLLALDRSGTNTLTLGFEDQALPTKLSYGSTYMGEGTGRLSATRLFADSMELTRAELRDAVFFCAERNYWFDVARAYADYVDAATGFFPPAIPAAAYEPVWCSWYPFEDEINERVIWENAKLCKEVGIGTILVDAGWNTGRFGDWHRIDGPYGDYEPLQPKFPDLKGLVARIKGELGLNVMFWVSLFWVGSESKAFQAGLNQARMRTGPERGENINLCPRHPLTRPRIAQIAEQVMSRFETDGLWVDFLDSIPLECTAEHEHVGDTIGDAFDSCMVALHQAITSVKPDALIEFRQGHANLRNKRYFTTAETNDTPHKFDINRRLGVLLRSCVSGVVPKADPTMWNPKCPDDEVARHLATVLMLGVPAISEDLCAVPPSHLAIVKAWLGFYRQHQRELLEGSFRPIGFEPTFPHLIIESEREGFVYLGSEAVPPLSLPLKETTYLLNASQGERLVLPLTDGPEGECSVELRDCFLTQVGEERVTLAPTGVLALSVPPGGMAILRPAAF